MNIAKMPLLVSLLPLAVCAAYDPTFYQFTRALLPGTNVASIASVTFDSDVYKTARNDFHDLRLTDEDGNEIPFLIKRATVMGERIERQRQGTEILSLTEKTNNTIIVELKLPGKKPAVNGLTISTPLKDFERAVTVFSSADRTSWKLEVENALVFDYTRFMDVNNREIPLPAQVQTPYLKLLISKVTDEQQSSLRHITRETRVGKVVSEQESITVRNRPFRMDRVTAWRDRTVKVPQSNVTVEYPISAQTITNDTKKQITILDLTVQRPPLTGISLDVSTINFSRQVDVMVPVPDMTGRGGEKWRPLVSKQVKNIKIGGFKQKNMRINFPEQRSERYRLVIHDYDNPQITVEKIHAWGNVYRLYFLPEKGQQYSLLSGNTAAAAARYDITALKEGLQRNVQTETWQAGPIEPNPAYDADTRRKNWISWLNTRIALGAALAIMVGGLGFAIWHTSRRVGKAI